jgi:hypothetical protein
MCTACIDTRPCFPFCALFTETDIKSTEKIIKRGEHENTWAFYVLCLTNWDTKFISNQDGRQFNMSSNYQDMLVRICYKFPTAVDLVDQQSSFKTIQQFYIGKSYPRIILEASICSNMAVDLRHVRVECGMPANIMTACVHFWPRWDVWVNFLQLY